MKTYQILLICLALIVMSSCKSKQVAVKPNGGTEVVSPPKPEPGPGFGPDIETPCVEKSMDDKDYFRGLGTGTDVNIGNARSASLRSAQDEINMKLGGLADGLNAYYAGTKAGKLGEKTQRAMEGEILRVVHKMLNDAEKVCERTKKDERGTFTTFIVLQIPKKEIVTNIENSLLDIEELKIDFNREEFRKFATERMKAMQDAKKNP